MNHPILMDPSGNVGRLYGAKTTPHMYVIDPAGKLVYRGDIDNDPMGREAPPQPTNHVAAALGDMSSSRPIAVGETKAYGCSVKY